MKESEEVINKFWKLIVEIVRKKNKREKSVIMCDEEGWEKSDDKK